MQVRLDNFVVSSEKSWDSDRKGEGSRPNLSQIRLRNRKLLGADCFKMILFGSKFSFLRIYPIYKAVADLTTYKKYQKNL